MAVTPIWITASFCTAEADAVRDRVHTMRRCGSDQGRDESDGWIGRATSAPQGRSGEGEWLGTGTQDRLADVLAGEGDRAGAAAIDGDGIGNEQKGEEGQHPGGR